MHYHNIGNTKNRYNDINTYGTETKARLVGDHFVEKAGETADDTST